MADSFFSLVMCWGQFNSTCGMFRSHSFFWLTVSVCWFLQLLKGNNGLKLICMCLSYILGEVIKLTDVKDFPLPLWLIFLICVGYYVAIFPFIGLGQWVLHSCHLSFTHYHTHAPSTYFPAVVSHVSLYYLFNKDNPVSRVVSTQSCPWALDLMAWVLVWYALSAVRP